MPRAVSVVVRAISFKIHLIPHKQKMPNFKTYCYAWTQSNVAECVCVVCVGGGEGGEESL